MSDLLPLLITALRDKTLVDTEDELNELHKRVETATSIEIIHDATNEEGDDNNDDDDIVVYASGKFEDGNWGKNDNLWDVPMKNTGSNSDDGDNNNAASICKLEDLKSCHVCVGGGFTIINFGDHPEGWLHVNEDTGEVECSTCFGGPFTLWVVFTIDGWPKEEWEPLLQSSDWEPGMVVPYFVLSVAKQFPKATVRFLDVAFAASTIRGPLKRLLPKKRRAKVMAEKAENRELARKEDFREAMSVVLTAHNEETKQELLSPTQLKEVTEFFEHCGYHNYVSADEKDITIKSRLIVHHVQLYLEKGKDILWQGAAQHKGQIETMVTLLEREARSHRQNV